MHIRTSKWCVEIFKKINESQDIRLLLILQFIKVVLPNKMITKMQMTKKKFHMLL